MAKTKAPCIRLQLDFAGLFMEKNVVILYDSYSKWIDVFPKSNISSKVTDVWEICLQLVDSHIDM